MDAPACKLQKVSLSTVLSPIEIFKGLSAKEERIECFSVEFEDINFIGAQSSTAHAIKTLNYCHAIDVCGCDLYRIATPENEKQAELLDLTARCGAEVMDIGIATVELSLILLIIIFNSLLIAAIIKYPGLHTITNRMIMSLAFSDLIFGVTSIYTIVMNLLMLSAQVKLDIEQLTRYSEIRSRKGLCLILDSPGLISTSMMASIFSLMAIAIEKYIAIFHPFRYFKLMSDWAIRAIVLVIWTISLFFGILQYFWNEFDQLCLFVEKSSYGYLVMWASVCFTSAVVTCVLYTRIFMTARKHARAIAARKDEVLRRTNSPVICPDKGKNTACKVNACKINTAISVTIQEEDTTNKVASSK